MSRPTLVLAGFPELASALESSGCFERVLSPSSTSQLRDCLGEVNQVPASSLVFLFADTLPVDTPQKLDFLVQRLVGMGYSVAMLELGPDARDIAGRSGGKVGLLPGPFHVNAVLGAVSGIPGMDRMGPLDAPWAFEAVTPGGPVPTAQAGGDQGAWGAPGPQAGPGGDPGWGAPGPDQGGWGAPGPQGGPGAQQPGSMMAGGGLSRRGFVLVVGAPKGGVGKSTLSTNLAAYMGHRLQQTGKNVVLLDTNVQNPDVGKILGQYRPTVVDVARYSNQLSPQVIQQAMVSRRDLNLDALLGPESPEKASPSYINGRLYRDITSELRRSYDYIIVDTSVADIYHDVFQNFVLPEMDYLMMVTIPNYQTLLNVDQFLRVITADKHAGGHSVDPRTIGVVLNQAQEGIGADERDVREELAAWQYLGQIPYSTEWLKAVNNHELVATKNFSQLNAAFDLVLYQITGEPVFAPTQDTATKKGLIGRLLPKRVKA